MFTQTSKQCSCRTVNATVPTALVADYLVKVYKKLLEPDPVLVYHLLDLQAALAVNFLGLVSSRLLCGPYSKTGWRTLTSATSYTLGR